MSDARDLAASDDVRRRAPSFRDTNPLRPAGRGLGRPAGRVSGQHPEGPPLDAVSVLHPPAAMRAVAHDKLTRDLLAAEARIAAGGVAPHGDPATLREALSAFDFAAPRRIDDVLDWTIGALEEGVTHVTHPRYFGLFNPAPTHASELADRVAGAFNPQLASATTSPAAVAIEAHVIAAVAARAGLPASAGGHFTTSGSEANFTALVSALTHAEASFAAMGVRAFAGAPVIYASSDCHLAWIKIAHLAGIGRDAVRLIATDGMGRIDLHALLECLVVDRCASCHPVMIVATAGTTNAGMVDPLVGCGDIARAFGCWFHVDAAWGGGAIASDLLRPALAGIEHADSITIDAHKWFATTMGCGMYLARDPATLTAAFEVGNSFMPSQARSVDPYMNSVQWSRRFLGLRLFLSLASAGWEGYAAHVEKAADLANQLRETMARSGWWACNRSELAVVCLVPPAGSPDVRAIVASVVGSGSAWISCARFEGRDVVRACITNGRSTAHDVDGLAEALQAAIDVDIHG